MKKRALGNSDIVITPIGFGAWAIGGGNWAGGWGPQDDKDSIAAIHRALDGGINWIDTAAVYGLGRSEEVVGKTLKERSDKPYVFTKCTLVWDNNRNVDNNMKADSIKKEVEDSLRRLQIDVIDLYQIHWPIPDEDIEEGWRTMEDLKKQGKVRYIGVSNFNVSQLQRAQAIAPVTSLQPPYSLLKPEVEKEILPYCEKNNIGVIVYSPMGSGMLTGAMTRERIENFPDDDWRKGNPEYREPRLTRNLELAELLKKIGNRHGRTAAEIAIAWVLLNSAVTAAIVGARRPSQIDGIIHAPEVTLTEDDKKEISDFLKQNP